MQKQKTAAKYGIDMLAHTAQQLNEAHFETYDIIYIFAQDVMQKALLIAPNEEAKSKLFYFTNIITPNQNTNVTDPWYYDEQVYDQVFQLIDKHCEALINSHIHTIRKSDK
jgi:protein-tyrosine phosphatase